MKPIKEEFNSDEAKVVDEAGQCREKSYSLPNVLYNTYRTVADPVESSCRTHTNEKLLIDSCNKLINLCQTNKWLEISTLLQAENAAEFNLSMTDNQGMTPLMFAVKTNQVNVANQLVQLGADLEERTKDGRSIMHIAAAHGGKEIVRFLISKNVSEKLPLPDNGQIPLHLAVCRPSTSAVQIVPILLKSYPESRLVQDKEGVIALMLACERRYLSVCQELLSQFGEQQTKLKRKDNGESVLHIAVRAKNVEVLKMMLDHKATVDAQNDTDKTPLYLAVENNFLEAVNLFYSVNADPNIVDSDHKSPLHIAAEMGHTQMIEILADKFKAPLLSRTQDGSTLMHIATKFGHNDVVQALLKRGVPLNLLNKKGAQGLHVAAAIGHTPIVKALLKKGANIDSKTKDNCTALHIAVQTGHDHIVEILLAYGCNVSIPGGHLAETPLHLAAKLQCPQKAARCAEMLIQCGADVDAKLTNGETALHVASKSSNLTLVNLLLKEGSNFKLASNDGKNPLHLAVEMGHAEIIKSIVEFVANSKSEEEAISLINQETSIPGQTAMHLLASSNTDNDTTIAEIFLKYHADPNCRIKETDETFLHLVTRFNQIRILESVLGHLPEETLQLSTQTKTGDTALMEACKFGHSEIVSLLLKFGAQYDISDQFGKTAMHIAAEKGHLEICDTLLQQNVFVDIRTKSGSTALHLSAQNGHTDLVNLFIDKYGASLEASDLEGNTALHLAAERGHTEICSVLLNRGANPAALNAKKHSPVHLATENDHPDIVKRFLTIHDDFTALLDHDAQRYTCAHLAAMKGSAAVIKELLKINQDAVLQAEDSRSRTTLHLAVMHSHRNLVKILLQAGSDSSLEDEDGMTPLMLAMKHGRVQIIRNFEKTTWNNPGKKTGLYPLHLASYFGQLEIAKLLIRCTSPSIESENVESCLNLPLFPELQYQYSLTPLHFACLSGEDSMVRFLLNLSTVNMEAATMPNKFTPLHLAAIAGHVSVAGLLLNRSRSLLTSKDIGGRSALHHAAMNGKGQIVEMLISQGANVDELDRTKWTPLHHACWSGELHVVDILVKNRCNVEALNGQGKIALCLAAANGHKEIVMRLIDLINSTDIVLRDKEFLFNILPSVESENFDIIEKLVKTSSIPIQTAVTLSRNYKSLADNRKVRSRDLYSCANYCQTMACQLINKSNSGSSSSSCGQIFESKYENGSSSFLDVLIENEQKLVISQNVTQNYVDELWLGNATFNPVICFFLFFACLFCPPIWIFCAMPLNSHWHKTPVIKFICHLISHVYFCLLLITVTLGVVKSIKQTDSIFPSFNELLLLFWILGLVIWEINTARIRSKSINLLRFCQILLCIAAIVIHILAFIFKYYSSMDGFKNMQIFIYIRNQCLSLALLLAFTQYLEFLSLHHLFGPWAVTIRHLIYDLTKFWVILFIFLLGFSFSITSLFQPITAYDVPTTNLTDSTGLLQTAETLYFAMFGLIEPDQVPGQKSLPGFSKFILKFLVGLYLMVIIVVLINLLIAMMSDTYRKIENRSDLEWKFGRAKLIREMATTDNPPIPINMFLYDF